MPDPPAIGQLLAQVVHPPTPAQNECGPMTAGDTLFNKGELAASSQPGCSVHARLAAGCRAPGPTVQLWWALRLAVTCLPFRPGGHPGLTAIVCIGDRSFVPLHAGCFLCCLLHSREHAAAAYLLMSVGLCLWITL